MYKYTPLVLGALFSSFALANTTLITNVKGYTVNKGELTTFNAIQFSNDTVDAIYQEQPENIGENVTVIDGNGQSILPGLIDAHGHVLGYGLGLQRVDLVGTQTEQDAVSRIVAYAKTNKESRWISGRGWNQVLWPSKTFPTAISLDKYFPERPVIMGRVDGHAIWVNSKAMEIAGITKDTVSPSGGEIIRDKAGNPTGVFIDNAMELIRNAIAPLTTAEKKQALIDAMNSLASYGLTSVHDAGITVENDSLYRTLADEQQMAIRINGMLSVEDKTWQEVLNKGPYATPDGFYKIDSVKISSDGALGSRGAAMIDDYSDHKGHKGLLLYKPDELAKLIKTSMKAGFQVNTHAIGDKANNLVLDQYEVFINETGSKNKRHRIEHAQILTLSDIKRFKPLGVIPSMQATHATSDKNMAEDRIGKERLAGAYAWRKLLSEGNIIANGSDFPVESPNPFYGLHAAITRQDHNNQPLDGWLSTEKMTPVEALASFTIDAAYAGHQDVIIGSLEAGKKADFILLDNDMFTQVPQSIWKNTVNETWVNGKQVYKK
ncbi:amidohydrolase [Thalassotalea euphylliae]|uniref:amidohydrolase n=1 Tax=Thalassotalea euphylliae TaxID=1655234 RepID=UPI003638CCE8